MEDCCDSHNYIQKTSSSSSPLSHHPPPPPSIHVYTLFFQNSEESSWNRFFLLETMQVGIKFTISFIWLLGYLVPPQWECGRDRLLEYIANISENTVGENHYWNILYYMKIKRRERGRSPGLENDRRGRPREHPKGHFRSKGPTRADIAQLPVVHVHTPSTPLRMTFGH